MPVTTTYPGVYIEELPSNSHPIMAAPTSIAAFIGYTHPFKTKYPGTPQEIFSFTEYEALFGGLYHSDIIPNDVAYAVYQFFVNGGSHAWVVGLTPQYQPAGMPVGAAAATIGNITFTAKEPTGALATDAHQMMVRIYNPKSSPNPNDTTDVQITYDNRVETYRGVRITPGANFIGDRLANSSLVTLTGTQPAPNIFGNSFTVPPGQTRLTLPAGQPPPGFTGVLSPADFIGAMQAETPLDKVDIFNLLVLPGIADQAILSAAGTFAEHKRAFLIMDPPANTVADSLLANPPGTPSIEDFWTNTGVPITTNGAIYFPFLKAHDPMTGDDINLPPSGTVAGLFAQTDNDRGVWKAPAGLAVLAHNVGGVVDTGRMTDNTQGTLNNLGINCLRAFPNVGTVVYGARTLVSSNVALSQWKYVPVRRMALFIEQTLYRNLTWAVFEPNDEPLWRALRTAVTDFMMSLFRQGAFQGGTPNAAFVVQCDSTTTRQEDIDAGRVNILVGFRPLKPAEFVVIMISQLAGQAQA